MFHLTGVLVLLLVSLLVDACLVTVQLQETQCVSLDRCVGTSGQSCC